MVFEFSVQRTFNQSIDVVDMGNTVLRCTNTQLLDFYIITRTILGKTHILKFGPICPDFDMLINEFSVNYKKIDYKESQVYKEIDKFINDFKKDINNVEEFTEYEAWQEFPTIQEWFENIKEF